MGVSEEEMEDYGASEEKAPAEKPVEPPAETPPVETPPAAASEPRLPARRWKTGETTTIAYAGRIVEGKVLLADGLARSLMLEFEAILGGHAGTMPILWNPEHGAYFTLMTGQPVGLFDGDPDAALTPLQLRVIETCRRLEERGMEGKVTLSDAAVGLEMEVPALCAVLNELLLCGLVPPPEHPTHSGAGITDPGSAAVS